MRRRPLSPRADELEPRRLLAAGSVEHEPNDSPGTAERIVLDSEDNRAVVSGVVDSPSDIDRFALTLPSGGRFRLRLANVAEDASGAIRLDAKVGRRKTTDDRFVSGESLVIDARGGRTVQIRIRAASEGDTAYTLSIVAVPIRAAVQRPLSGGMVREVEPNETAERANRIVLPDFAPIFIRGVGGAFDLDTFAFRSARGGPLQIDNFTAAGPARYLLETDEFPTIVSEFSEIPAGGSVTIPIYRGVPYRLRWIIDAPTPTPYVLRLQVLPQFSTIGAGAGTALVPPSVPPFGSATLP